MKATFQRLVSRIANRASQLVVAGRAGLSIWSANRWRDAYNPLRGLTMARVVSLLEAGQRGEMADLQFTYRAIERRNSVLRALVQRRTASLLRLDWDIKIPDTLPAGATPEMAEAQRLTLRSWYDRIDNFRGSLRHLALAEFRGYAHLQVQTDGEDPQAGFEAVRRAGRFRLEPLAQWHWVRDGMEGQWGWNREDSVRGWDSVPDALRADPVGWGLIVREVEAPIDEIGLIVHVRRAMSQKDWDAFVEIYGVPGGVVIMPPNIPEGRASEYETAATRIAEGGSGALPNGSDYKANDGPRGSNPFRDHIDYQDQELVLAGTGGKLTMLTESGSGTLAGGAHQDAFDDLAEAEAEEISEVFQRQFDRRVLELEHPGQPQLAYFELAAEQEEDVDALVKRVVDLSGAGFRVKAEEVSERTGLSLTADDPAAAVPPEPRAPEGRRMPTAGAPKGMPMVNAARAGLQAAGVRQVAAAVHADLAPLVKRLAAIEAISDPGIRAARLEALLAEWSTLEADITADPEAAQALARLQGAAMANGLAGQAAMRAGE